MICINIRIIGNNYRLNKIKYIINNITKKKKKKKLIMVIQ